MRLPVQYIALLAVFAGMTSSVALGSRRFKEFDKDGKPNLQSRTALVVDLVTGQTLFERDADVERPIASLSKLMGALVILSECPLAPDGLHQMSESNRVAAKGGDHSRLTTGWKYSHRDILHAALMRSDNRALPALGESCGMTPSEMGQRMTARARRMGLTRTHFAEPNGLSMDNISTAREMLVILREAVKIPEVKEILGTRQFTITGYNKNGRAQRSHIPNTDRLLGRGGLEVIGGKTGYTDPARYCLAIALRTMHGQEVGFVLLGAEGKLTRFADVTRVTRWLTRNLPTAPLKDMKNGRNAAVSEIRPSGKEEPSLESNTPDIPESNGLQDEEISGG